MRNNFRHERKFEARGVKMFEKKNQINWKVVFLILMVIQRTIRLEKKKSKTNNVKFSNLQLTEIRKLKRLILIKWI